MMTISGCSNNQKKQDSKNNTGGSVKKTEDINNQVHEEENFNSEISSLDEDLSQTQKNSIAMLNYLAVTSNSIENSKESRIYLEEVYSSLINNTNPDKIDENTQDQITNMLDIVEDYRMISVKRDRLQYLYNQDKANLMREAMPNPLDILTVANALDWKRMVGAIAYTALDSYNNYKKAEDELDKQFMINGWELDDEEAANIHKNRKRTFNYMIDIVRDNALPGNMTLNEEDVENFVKYCNTNNVYSKIEFLESNVETYGNLTNYWLELAKSYYEIEDYKKVLDCVEEYKNNYTGVFRRDYEYASIIPEVIFAAQNVCDANEYILLADLYMDDLISNSKNEDWSSKYFAAQVYMDLYTKTDNKEYLRKAYNLALDNVNFLTSKQKELNDTYISDVEEIKLDSVEDNGYISDKEKKEAKKKFKEEKKRVKKLNKSLKQKRKTELPSVYEPLILNCDLLFGLANKLEIDDKEKNSITGILETNNNGVFITKTLNNDYSFSDYKRILKAEVRKNTIIIPVKYLTEDCEICVTIGKDKYKKWSVGEVKRNSKNIDDFYAYLYNDNFKKRQWKKGEIVKIEVKNLENEKPTVVKYKVTSYINHYLLPDKVEFKKYE